MTVSGRRDRRSALTLSRIGPAVFSGGFSTFLAFASLFSSESHVFKTFFKVKLIYCHFLPRNKIEAACSCVFCSSRKTLSHRKSRKRNLQRTEETFLRRKGLSTTTLIIYFQPCLYLDILWCGLVRLVLCVGLSPSVSLLGRSSPVPSRSQRRHWRRRNGWS